MIHEEQKELITDFMRKPAKSGDFYHYTIPQDYIDYGIIDPDEKVLIQVYRIKERED